MLKPGHGIAITVFYDAVCDLDMPLGAPRLSVSVTAAVGRLLDACEHVGEARSGLDPATSSCS
ncbi:hypothetical protein [Streptomyces sp. NPDC058964]|uniref:hypothetical protein n=1 Tax=Streptomyces sp. NPDC058964 TaxID=3346681 RepID=UPI0036C471CF